MPIENEYKHVLRDDDGSLETKLSSSWPKLEIEQFYLGDRQARFRRIVDAAGLVSFVFTFKQSIAGKLLEIETPVTQDDFDLARTASTGGLHKTRFVRSEGQVHWDVDFLYEVVDGRRAQRPYFVMAEAEMADGMSEHDVHPEILPHLVYSVPKDESHVFTNGKLIDPAYARERMASLGSDGALATP
jgi:hypothetical protein